MAKAERITDAAKALGDTMADNVSQTFADYCRQHPEVTHGYAIPLDDDAAAELAKQFRLNVAEDLKTTKNPENDIPGLVRNAFDRAAANLVGQKVAMLQQLDAMGLDEPVKELAASFIVSEQGLTAAQFQAIWAAATAQRDLLQGMLAANPPKTAGEIAAALRGFMQALNVPEAAAPLTAKAAMEKATGLAMALLGLSAPPAGLDGVRALRDQLDSAQMRGKLAMLKQAVRAADTPEQAAPVNLFIDTAETVCRALCDKAREMDVAQQQAQISLSLKR